MIRIDLTHVRGELLLIAEGEPHRDYPASIVTSALPCAQSRPLQARVLIDAAAALLDDGTDDYAAAFERLHDVLDDLPEERREES